MVRAPLSFCREGLRRRLSIADLRDWRLPLPRGPLPSERPRLAAIRAAPPSFLWRGGPTDARRRSISMTVKTRMRTAAVRLQPLARPELIELVAGWLAEKENYQWLDFRVGRRGMTPAWLKILTQRKDVLLRVYTTDAGSRSAWSAWRTSTGTSERRGSGA